MRLIIGLGNPGKEYAKTRHNAGFMFVDALIAEAGLPAPNFDKKNKSEITKVEISNKKIILAKPLTFMNESGAAVRALVDFYKIKNEETIVVHDDKDIPLGEFRFQKNRGSAGHNGVASIIERLGTKNFSRLRLGVRPKNEIKNTADFVLKKFNREEEKIVKETIKAAIKFLIAEL